MNATREVCHCGHAKDTHFKKSGACLGMRCDACHDYRDDSRPDPYRLMVKKPNHPPKWRGSLSTGGWADCECYECKQYAAASRAA